MLRLLISAVALLTGAQSLVATVRPALLVRCAACRHPSPCARLGDGEAHVNFDESGDECVVSEAGSTCMTADVAGPISWTSDGLDEERRSRSPQDGRRKMGAGFVPFSFQSPTANINDEQRPTVDIGARASEEFVPVTPVRRRNPSRGYVPFGSSGRVDDGFQWPGPIVVPPLNQQL